MVVSKALEKLLYGIELKANKLANAINKARYFPGHVLLAGCYHERMKKAATAVARSPRPQATDNKRNEKHVAEASVFIDHDLEQAIPYLVARAGMRMGQAFSKELKPFGLTLTEWRVCAALHHKPHQRLAELATHTSAEPSTLSRTVEGLLQRGLLIRDRSGDDARALALSLTPEGDALAQRIIPLAQLYDRVALSGISATQVDLLRDMLRRIYSNIETLDKGS